MKAQALSLAAGALFLVGATPDKEQWVPGWSAPPIAYEPNSRDNLGIGRPLKDETVRQDLRAGIAARQLRVRLTNELADDPLRIGAASVVRIDGAGVPVAGSLRMLTFGGAQAARIPARAPLLSDPVDYPVAAGERLAVSVYFPDEATPPAHAQMVDLASGNVVGATTLPRARRVRAAGIVSALELSGTAARRVLVTYGDSITEGAGATPGQAMSWPDQLGRMLAADRRGRCWAVANVGISGNRLLNTGRGPNGLARFDRDVLSVPGATHIVILEGINDIGKVRDPAERQPAASEIIAAYEQLLARAQAQGLRVIVGTLLPFEGAAYADGAAEERRLEVNAWIRANARRFDGLIDFDVAMGEPGQPKVMRLAEQVGDHLHPNDVGYARMARTALPAILRQGCP
ncbi:SGNH/GDSL hydrolase family protein [Novosphingobium flavum]|uniref:SGNH/GDSL hydrolase family protein n=1 Tax=Novosphingobium flavum TaxID=1778672 RepID=A0A7X1FNU1_9SPHN|nr:SGNH/GDSL hydrolase family protein [Novosphingobium flavum]MBC2664216.1 SGNH/GDSL hydrolase family protein [Novosphingobium flavum]